MSSPCVTGRIVPVASAVPTSFDQAPATTADSPLANSTMPQPSTPSSVAMRCEASTKTSAGAVPAATAVASSRITACSSDTRASSTRPATTTTASEEKTSTALSESAATLCARACAS